MPADGALHKRFDSRIEISERFAGNVIGTVLLPLDVSNNVVVRGQFSNLCTDKHRWVIRTGGSDWRVVAVLQYRIFHLDH